MYLIRKLRLMNKLDLYTPRFRRTRPRRNDKIAVQIRECMANVLARGELYDLVHLSLTVTHVDLSPDLRNATIFIMTSSQQSEEEILSCLVKNKHYFKNTISQKVHIKFIPELNFKIDNSFEYSQKINAILNKHTIL